MPNYAAVILAEPTLVSYWKLDDPPLAIVAVDSKGNNHGVYNGGITLRQPGLPNTSIVYSALFDGNSGYVFVPSSPSLHPVPGPWSLEAWVYTQFNPALVGFRGVAGVPALGNFEYMMEVDSTLQPGAAAWHHIVATWNGGDFSQFPVNHKYYVDSISVSYPFFSNDVKGEGAFVDFLIGSNQSSGGSGGLQFFEFFQGYIAQVALYSSELSQATIQAHYQAGIAQGPLPGNARLSQLVVEVARGQNAGNARVSQVCVEVLTPFLAGSTHTFSKSASASIVFHPAAQGQRQRSGAATASVVFTPTAMGFRIPVGIYKAATATVVFSAQAVLTNVKRGVTAAARIIFKARASNRVRPVVFGDDYLGRFQVGQDLPLWCAVRDQHGSLALPTTTPPVADIYNLDTHAHVESVEVSRLRGSRVDSVYAMPHLLGFKYTTGRHAIVYRATAGGFTGYTISIFEVVPGGDTSGPVIALHTFSAPGGDQTMGQLGSGAIARGSRPRLG